jgi:hypothetical protein
MIKQLPQRSTLTITKTRRGRTEEPIAVNQISGDHGTIVTSAHEVG